MSDIQTIISKYLADVSECTTQEKLDLENFLNASEENRRLFDEMKALWDAGTDIPNFRPDADAAWEKLHKKIAATEPPPFTSEKQDSFVWMRVAATILLLIGFGAVISYFFSAQPPAYLSNIENSNQETKKVMLPDGSAVWLNKKSVLAWNNQYGQKERKVYLVGEAYFEVAHNKQNPFIILTNYGTQTKVLGTSFNIKSRVNDSAVFLQVLTGEVEFKSLHQETSSKLILKKGEAAFTKSENSIIYKSSLQENFLAWKEQKLTFSNTSLEQLGRTLEDYFSIQVHISPSIRSCHFTGTFQSPALSDILDGLQKTMSIKFEIKGQAVSLSGTGCTPDNIP